MLGLSKEEGDAGLSFDAATFGSGFVGGGLETSILEESTLSEDSSSESSSPDSTDAEVGSSLRVDAGADFEELVGAVGLAWAADFLLLGVSCCL